MIRAELKIVCAAIAMFAALIGLALVLDGLVFDILLKLRYVALTLIIGITCFVVLLNPGPYDHG